MAETEKADFTPSAFFREKADALQQKLNKLKDSVCDDAVNDGGASNATSAAETSTETKSASPDSMMSLKTMPS